MRKGKPPPKAIEYNPINEPERAHGYRNVRWVENVSCGLRLVGFADEIANREYSRSIDHKGWYTEDDPYVGSEVYRGVVYQLPSRGEPLYVYGYADPNNPDCALLCFDPEHDKMRAAYAADRFAEIYAEEEREYQQAWQAGRRAEEIEDEIKETRKKALALGKEIRILRREVDTPAPTVCAVLRGKIMSLYGRIQKARKERDELVDTFGKHPGFVE